MKPPIKWLGGKQRMLKFLLPRVPKHNTYCEVFGGSGALLFAKPKCLFEIYNDMNVGLVNFFIVLQTPDMFKEFYEKVQVTPFSRELYREYTKTWDKQETAVEKAHQWYTVTRQSMNALFGMGWAISKVRNESNVWFGQMKMLPEMHKRFKDVQVWNVDWRTILKFHDSQSAFFYLDPPYVMSTRTTGERYAHELSDDDHEELIDTILKLKGKVLLSGYPNPIYDDKLSGKWTRESFDLIVDAGKGRDNKGIVVEKTEVLWYNYSVQLNLF